MHCLLDVMYCGVRIVYSTFAEISVYLIPKFQDDRQLIMISLLSFRFLRKYPDVHMIKMGEAHFTTDRNMFIQCRESILFTY